MNKVVFELDEIPKIMAPFDFIDHNLGLIYGLIFTPLFRRKKNKFYSEFIHDLSKDGYMKFEFKSSQMAQDFVTTILYILRKKSLFWSYLSFIDGVNDYMKGMCTLDDIRIKLEDNVVTAKVNDLSVYKDVFSTIQFAPLKTIDMENNVYEGYGAYSLEYYDDTHICLKRKCNHLGPEYVEFIDKKIKSNLDITYFDFGILPSMESIDNETSFEMPSLLQARIKISDKLMVDYGTSLKNELIYTVLSIKQSYLFDTLENKSINRVNFDYESLPQKIRVLWADYYPNSEIMKFIIDKFHKNGISTVIKKEAFNDFLYDYQNKKYDIAFNIIEPITFNRCFQYMSEMRDIPSKYRSKYVDLVNSWIKADSANYKNEEEEKIKEYIQKYSTSAYIGKLRLIYHKKRNAHPLNFDDYGVLINI